MHPRRQHIHVTTGLGPRLADAVVGAMGSWRFIVWQTVIVAAWIVANVWLLTHPFDPAPFIGLNLAFSLQAAYASPLILLASNRQAERDRARDSTEAEEVELLVKINTQQLAILHRLDAVLLNQADAREHTE